MESGDLCCHLCCVGDKVNEYLKSLCKESSMDRWNEVMHYRGICVWDVAVCSDAGNIHDLSVPVEMNISISAFRMYLI